MTGAIPNGDLLDPQLVGYLLGGPEVPSPATRVRLGLTMRFLVRVDGLSLGHWSSCTGLKVEFKSTSIHEGGEYRRSTLVPDKVEYGDITLKRAVHASGSQAVALWLHSAVEDWVNFDYRESSTATARDAQTASISVLDGTGANVYTWNLRGVYPKSWSGPELNATASGVATETLVLSYDGFDGWV